MEYYMDDIARALALLEKATELSDDEATELLTELVRAETDPASSNVLYPPDNAVSFGLESSDGGMLFVVIRRVYICRFVFLVRETKLGNRRILSSAPLRD
jgi:hypothetical protein